MNFLSMKANLPSFLLKGNLLGCFLLMTVSLLLLLSSPAMNPHNQQPLGSIRPGLDCLHCARTQPAIAYQADNGSTLPFVLDIALPTWKFKWPRWSRLWKLETSCSSTSPQNLWPERLDATALGSPSSAHAFNVEWT